MFFNQSEVNLLELSYEIFFKGSVFGTAISGPMSLTWVGHARSFLSLCSVSAGRGEFNHLASDRQGTVLASTASSGGAEDTCTAYGYSKGMLTSFCGFHGELRSSVTGHYQFGRGHRQMNPVLMRFNSPDKLSPFGKGGLNAYAFMLDDPVNGSDPTGAYKISGVPLVLKKDHVLLVTQLAPRQPRVLNLMAHAEPGFVTTDKGLMGPADFVDYLKRLKLNPQDYDYRIIGCNSGTAQADGQSSFAKGLSDIVGRPVEGYVGNVSFSIEHKVDSLTRHTRVGIEIAESNPYAEGTKQYGTFACAPVVVDVVRGGANPLLQFVQVALPLFTGNATSHRLSLVQIHPRRQQIHRQP